MKRSPDYYNNHKQLKSLKHNNVVYKANTTDAWKWFHILNEQIFGGLLEPVEKIIISSHKDHEHHYALYHYDQKDKSVPCKISFWKTFDDEKQFVEILAHEMIHHFQHSYNEPLGHGPSFLSWRDNFKLKGLNLYRAR